MKKTALIFVTMAACAIFLFSIPASPQQFKAGPAATLDASIRAAAANCQPSFPCAIYIPPEIGALPKGTITCSAYPAIFDPAGVSGCASGQATAPGGLNGQVQVNSNGAFAGFSSFTFLPNAIPATLIVNSGGSGAAGSIQIGPAGAFGGSTLSSLVLGGNSVNTGTTLSPFTVTGTTGGLNVTGGLAVGGVQVCQSTGTNCPATATEFTLTAGGTSAVATSA